MSTVELRRTKLIWGADYPNEHYKLTTIFTVIYVDGVPVQAVDGDTSVLESVLEKINIPIKRTGEW